MKDSATYYTLKGRSEGLYKEKGSKFIGIAVPCLNEDEAKEHLEKWRKEHHQARHLCYAYRFGRDHSLYRANDDGEPNNSAGVPILGQIKAFDLTNVLIGVVRYYGGTKLGVGGLVNAYKTAAKEAIEHGKILKKEVFQWYELQFGYDDMAAVMQFINVKGLEMVDPDFQIDCKLKFSVPLSDEGRILEDLKLLEVEINDLGIY